MAKKGKSSTGLLAAEIGAGLAAAGAAAAAGYYFYASDDAKKHRKVAAKWADGMKKEVVKQTKKLEKVSAADVARAVDVASTMYQKARAVDPAELKRAAQELKKNWEMVRAEAMKGMSSARSTAKKAGGAAKKAVASGKKAVAKVRSAGKKVAKKRR